MRRLVGLLISTVAVTVLGCATTPDPVRDAEVSNLGVGQVRLSPEQFHGTRIRWGGDIVDIQNRPDVTVIEVLSRPLKAGGAPKTGSEGEGRFRAELPGFLDPSDYTSGRWITVVGTIYREEKGKIGDYPYTFPVVAVESHRLWRSRDEIEPPPPGPHYYDPWWWDPWYLHRPWPYYRRWR